MATLEFRIEVPPKLEPKFEAALEKAVRELIEGTEFSVARDILSRSELTEEQANRLAKELKKGVAKQHWRASQYFFSHKSISRKKLTHYKKERSISIGRTT